METINGVPAKSLPMTRFEKNRTRVGYTLLELLLALGLSVVVFAAVAGGIQVYLVALTKQQAMVEQKQVARALLAMIGNDLRAGIQYKATDYSGLDNLIQTQTMMLTGGGEAAEEEEEPESLIVEEEVSFRPTMLGSANVLMIDISRLPRLDQYNPLVASAEDEVQSPSDIKSLSYFVSLSDGGVESAIEFQRNKAPGGLYRREIDRAVAEYRGETELMMAADEYTRLIANEVVDISFQYFDGEEWQSEWDSVENGGFPVAIEVNIMIDPVRSAAGSQDYTIDQSDPDQMQIFRTVVDLPVAEPIESEGN
ncbi:type II secretion system protein GspJ [bacterium]|jgi:type II secretory pathway pseudopilin PulG|nr:type II secretion system protein GspJ [Mariniblastus sp.]MDB4368307.1 type II secretion system protein GspJ [Mariniblastus sp.]MDB4372938.1 type II secretion system protein GspJ [Mariniblastus sp.]MDB4468318.1 type II secretion system protein GspJ [bacterium]MDB4483711.1 type II secretion system protein GspJ [bacterium]